MVVQPDSQTIRVSASHQFVVISPIAGALIGSNRWQVASQSTMRVEG
jgi:hypothetical protein